jgi:hypothetical protein
MKISKKSKPTRTLDATAASIFKCDSDNNKNVGEFDPNTENDPLTEDHFIIPPTLLGANDYKDMGCACAEKGSESGMREALTHFEMGLEIEPTNFILWELKAQVLLSFDKLLAAIEAAEEVTRLAPLWPEGFVTLARAQREFGEIELALVSMQTAITLLGTDDDVPSAEEYIQELSEIQAIVTRLLAARDEYEAEKKNHSLSCSTDTCTGCATASSSSPSPSVPPLPRCYSRMSVVAAGRGASTSVPASVPAFSSVSVSVSEVSSHTASTSTTWEE